MSTRVAVTDGVGAARRPPEASSRVPVAIAVAAFTPYLGVPLDIRVEHLIVYGLAIAAVAARQQGLAPRSDALTRRMVTLWTGSAVYISINTFIWQPAPSIVQRVVVTLSVLDNFLLPLATLLALATYGLRRDVDARDGLRAACSAVVLLLSLNSLMILLIPLEVAQPVLRLFWSNEASPYLYVDAAGFTSVAARVVTDGRYGGVFNQPYDGGLGYAVGLAAWFVLYTRRARGVGLFASPVTQFLALGLIIAGGISTLSKVFIYGAVLVTIASLGLPLTGTRTTIGRSLAILATAPAATVFVAERFMPESGERAFGLLNVYGSDDAVYRATGGRVSDFALYPSKLASLMTPTGRGFVGIRDDAFLAFSYAAGPIGLVVYFVILAQLFILAARLPAFSVERRLALSLALLTATASLGAIPLQVNRGSSLLWLMLGLLYPRAHRYQASLRARGRPMPRPIPRAERTVPGRPVRAVRAGRPGRPGPVGPVRRPLR